MIWLKLTLSILSGLASAPSYAQSNCSKVDLNEAADSPLRKIPIYDQDGTEACYAYVAAQMTDFHRIKVGDFADGLTSPAYTGWVYRSVDNPRAGAKSINQGLPYRAIESLNRHGACSEAEVKRRLARYTSAGNMTEAEVLQFLDRTQASGTPLDWTAKKSEISQSFAPTCNLDSLKTLLASQQLFGVATTEFLKTAFAGCRAYGIKTPEVKVYDMGSDALMQGKIDEALARGYPAGVSVCDSVLTNPAGRPLRSQSPPLVRLDQQNLSSQCATHSVMVTGRKEINGSCRYLVRNSYGAHWRGPSPNLCACIDRNGAYKDSCQPEEASEFVGCWFTSKDLAANAGRVFNFE